MLLCGVGFQAWAPAEAKWAPKSGSTLQPLHTCHVFAVRRLARCGGDVGLAEGAEGFEGFVLQTEVFKSLAI